MERFVRGFIKASLVWLGVGVLIGLAMALRPYDALVFRPAHVHANLLGFVSMMIFGVAYHVIPRFSGRPLYAPRLAFAHLWVSNAGLATLAGGWLVRPFAAAGGVLVGAGAVVSAAGAFMFIYNIWRTLGSGEAKRPRIHSHAPPAAAGR